MFKVIIIGAFAILAFCNVASSQLVIPSLGLNCPDGFQEGCSNPCWDATCESIYVRRALNNCPMSCEIKCVCKDGLNLDRCSGNCVKVEDCPTSIELAACGSVSEPVPGPVPGPVTGPVSHPGLEPAPTI